MLKVVCVQEVSSTVKVDHLLGLWGLSKGGDVIKHSLARWLLASVAERLAVQLAGARFAGAANCWREKKTKKKESQASTKTHFTHSE